MSSYTAISSIVCPLFHNLVVLRHRILVWIFSRLLDLVQAIKSLRFGTYLCVMAARLPRLAINDSLSPVSETGSPIDPTARKLTLFRKIRPLPLKHAWTFYHDKASYQSSTTYENRLTPLHENIITVQKFWEVWNSFPFESLRLKDSVHLFKRGVKPVWEDRRNINGGAWTFRIPKGRAVDFFEAILLMAVGEQFNDKMEPGNPALPFR